jgi:hypothetical protein
MTQPGTLHGWGPARVFALTLLPFILLTAAWSLATPLFGAPDEPVHVIKAVAVAHGQLLGRQPQGPSSPLIDVRVPGVYADSNRVARCFAFKNNSTPNCAPHLSRNTAEQWAPTYVGRYPPLYYAIVGTPSLVLTSPAGVYAMRLVSAVLNSVFLALAVTCVVVWSRSRLLLAGLTAAVTPTVGFFAGVVNPSGFEICLAICLWVSGLVLVSEHATEPPKALIGIVAVSAILLTLVRGLSPFWLGMVVLALAGFAGRDTATRLARYTYVRRWAVGVLVAFGASLAWIFTAGTLEVLPSINKVTLGTSDIQMLLKILGNTGTFIHEMIGQFGWLDTPAPRASYETWYLAIGAIGALALVVARRTQVAVFLFVLVGTILLPVLVSGSQARGAGYVWQGKDTLPFAVGIPLVAFAIVAGSKQLSPYRGRMTGMFVVAIPIASMLAFAEALRRNTVGVTGPVDFLGGRWSPPVGDITVLLMESGALLLLALLFARWVRRPQDSFDGRSLPSEA